MATGELIERDTEVWVDPRVEMLRNLLGEQISAVYSRAQQNAPVTTLTFHEIANTLEVISPMGNLLVNMFDSLLAQAGQRRDVMNPDAGDRYGLPELMQLIGITLANAKAGKNMRETGSYLSTGITAAADATQYLSQVGVGEELATLATEMRQLAEAVSVFYQFDQEQISSLSDEFEQFVSSVNVIMQVLHTAFIELKIPLDMTIEDWFRQSSAAAEGTPERAQLGRMVGAINTWLDTMKKLKFSSISDTAALIVKHDLLRKVKRSNTLQYGEYGIALEELLKKADGSQVLDDDNNPLFGVTFEQYKQDLLDYIYYLKAMLKAKLGAPLNKVQPGIPDSEPEFKSTFSSEQASHIIEVDEFGQTNDYEFGSPESLVMIRTLTLNALDQVALLRRESDPLSQMPVTIANAEYELEPDMDTMLDPDAQEVAILLYDHPYSAGTEYQVTKITNFIRPGEGYIKFLAALERYQQEVVKAVNEGTVLMASEGGLRLAALAAWQIYDAALSIRCTRTTVEGIEGDVVQVDVFLRIPKHNVANDLRQDLLTNLHSY